MRIALHVMAVRLRVLGVDLLSSTLPAVSISTRIGNRYDPALYIARTPCVPTRNCALESTYCAVDTLGPDDAANHNEIYSNDQKDGQDR